MDVGVGVDVLGLNHVLTAVSGQLHQPATQEHWVYQLCVDRCVGGGVDVGVGALGVNDVLIAVSGELSQPVTQGHWVYLLCVDGFVFCCG